MTKIATAQISNVTRNRMGTASFHGKFQGMRKAQDFIVYPIKAGDDASRIMVQSDTRIGFVYMQTGVVEIAGPFASGAYGVHLAFRKPVGTLTGEELTMLKAGILATAHGDAGRAENGVIGTDNSGALEIFG